MSEKPTQFDYLLNAFESASQSPHPSLNGYLEKRTKLIEYVRDLERRAAPCTTSGETVGQVPGCDYLGGSCGCEKPCNAFAAFERHRIEQGKILGMPGLHARPAFIAGWNAALSQPAAPDNDSYCIAMHSDGTTTDMNAPALADHIPDATKMVDQVPDNGKTIPEGWKLMPDELTDEMAEHIAMSCRCCGGIAYDMYRTLLEIAPQPPKEE